MSLIKLLQEFNLHKNLKDVKRFLESHDIGFDHEVDYYLGSGAMGDAYKVKGKNKVIKITQYDTKEKKIYDTIKKENNLNHVCNVFFCRKVGNTDLMLVVMEFLDEPDINLNRINNFLILSRIEAIYVSGNIDTSKNDVFALQAKEEIDDLGVKYSEEEQSRIKGYIDKLTQVYSSEPELLYCLLDQIKEPRKLKMFEETVKQMVEYRKFFGDVFIGIKEYDKMGITHDDVYIPNILKDPKTGNYKLIDPRPTP